MTSFAAEVGGELIERGRYTAAELRAHPGELVAMVEVEPGVYECEFLDCAADKRQAHLLSTDDDPDNRYLAASGPQWQRGCERPAEELAHV